MVASAHPLASGVGSKMLRAGGNAFDAVVATCWVEAERRLTLAILAVLGGCAREAAPSPVPMPPKVIFDTLITSRSDDVRCNADGTHGHHTASGVDVGTRRTGKIRCFAENFWMEKITVTLHRNVFKTAAERDSYYAKQIRRLAKD